MIVVLRKEASWGGIGGAAGQDRVAGCGSGRGELLSLSGTQTRRKSCDEKEEDERQGDNGRSRSRHTYLSIMLDAAGSPITGASARI